MKEQIEQILGYSVMGVGHAKHNALHMSIDKDLTIEEIDSIYGDNETFFRTYLEEKATK